MSLLQKYFNVIPAKAGIQVFQGLLNLGCHRGDGFVEFCKRLFLLDPRSNSDMPTRPCFPIPEGDPCEAPWVLTHGKRAKIIPTLKGSNNPGSGPGTRLFHYGYAAQPRRASKKPMCRSVGSVSRGMMVQFCPPSRVASTTPVLSCV